MTDLMQADIFFFITSILVAVVGICLLIILFYVIRIIRRIDHIAGAVKEEGDALLYDIKLAHAKMKSEGIKMRHLLSLVVAVVRRGFTNKTKRKKKKD
ncbi:MAG: hypothetical protein WDZ88_03615 [Candidatus Paceibacterota bacterium]